MWACRQLGDTTIHSTKAEAEERLQCIPSYVRRKSDRIYPLAVIDVSDEAALVEQVAREIAENEGFDAKGWKYSQPIARDVLAAVGLVKTKGNK